MASGRSSPIGFIYRISFWRGPYFQTPSAPGNAYMSSAQQLSDLVVHTSFPPQSENLALHQSLRASLLRVRVDAQYQLASMRTDEEAIDAEGFQLRKVITESARLRRASASAGDQVPSGRVFDAGNSRPGIRIDHEPTRQFG